MHMVIWVKGSPCAKNAYRDSYGSSFVYGSIAKKLHKGIPFSNGRCMHMVSNMYLLMSTNNHQLEDEEDDVDEVESLVVVVPWPHNKIM